MDYQGIVLVDFIQILRRILFYRTSLEDLDNDNKRSYTYKSIRDYRLAMSPIIELMPYFCRSASITIFA